MDDQKKVESKQKNTAFIAFKSKGSKGFIRNRFFALLIDFIIVSLLCQFVIFPLFGTPDWNKYLQTQDMIRGLTATDPLVVERMRLYQECFVISLAIGAAYETLMLICFHATVGKLIFGMRVEMVRDGRNFFVSRLLFVLRALVKMISLYLLSALPFMFMCLTAFGNADRRSGFDILSSTKVIDRRQKS